ncbi:hypothetical protein [Pseudonocardia zijingensis]|uniref:Uncharacterized protein n=1 Tax=Pseudonocardia zijingensis TaxID=153376 RepID=A0ABN1N8X4_9PSEU
MSDDYKIRPCTTRLDVEVNAGESIDLLVPILDCHDEPVAIPIGSEGSWSARAQVRRNALASTVLHEWSTDGDTPNAVIVPGTPGKVRLLATDEETTGWQATWPDYTCSWDIELTEPAANGGETHRIAEGPFGLRAQHTR